MHEYIKIILTCIAGLLSGIALTCFKFWYENRKKPGHSVDADLDRRNKVKSFLHEVLSNYKPAHASCYLLHNGGTFFTGDHMQKIKLFEEESRDRNVSRLRKDFDSVMIEGPLHWWIDTMRSGKDKEGAQEEFIFSKVEDIANDEFRAMMLHYRFFSQYARLIRNSKTGNPVAIFVSSYDTPQEFNSADIYGLRTEAKLMEKIILEK